MTNLEKLLIQLPLDLQKEVEDFAAYLAQRDKSPRGKNLKLDWAGALSDLGTRYTSAELQHTVLQEWGD